VDTEPASTVATAGRPAAGGEGASQGFTLIEVLVAMVILAIGLLGLEALGIGAARSIALAERQSGYVTLASDSLESALDQLRRGVVPANFCQVDLRFGDRMSRQVQLPGPPPADQLATVTITVLPNPESINAPREPFQISSSLYLATAITGSPSGSACG
jgi:prepilin-type N-terminal cleavage/methylation domain-containing protein